MLTDPPLRRMPRMRRPPRRELLGTPRSRQGRLRCRHPAQNADRSRPNPQHPHLPNPTRYTGERYGHRLRLPLNLMYIIAALLILAIFAAIAVLLDLLGIR
jgi:hypothetical protein